MDAYLGHNEQFAIIKMRSVYNKEHKTYHMHHQTEIKTIQKKTKFLKFVWKLESYGLFENWSFKDYLKIGFLEIQCKNENFRN